MNTISKYSLPISIFIVFLESPLLFLGIIIEPQALHTFNLCLLSISFITLVSINKSPTRYSWLAIIITYIAIAISALNIYAKYGYSNRIYTTPFTIDKVE